MKRLTIGASLVIFGALAVTAAAGFPYVDPLTSRYSLTTSTTISSFDPAYRVQVPKVNGGMQANENVAVIECSVANLTAIDALDWAEESAKVVTPQAALSLKSKDDSSLVWMGYLGGSGDAKWFEFSGATAEEGAYDLRIEIDYTVSPKMVRYSVKKSGDDDYTILAYGDNAWNPLGDSAKKVAGIDLYGYGTVNSASGDCGDRATLTTVATTEAVDMNYSNLVVKASAKDVWGANTMTVTLKKGGETVQTQVIDNLQPGDHDYEVTFDKAQAGEQYTYDVTFGYPTGVHTDVVKDGGTAKLFSEIDWFGFDGGAFTNAIPESGKIEIDMTKGTFASVDDQVGLITPMTASSENAKTVVETVMTISSVYAWTELPDVNDTQLSIALVENSTSTGRTWAYKVGNAAWAAISSSVPTASGTYTVKVEFDYASEPKQAKVWVKKGDAAYAVLKDQIALTTNKLNTAAVMGGDVNAMNASFKTTQPAEVLPAGNEIPVTANTVVDLKNLTVGGEYTLTGATDKFHLRWKDDTTGDGKWAKIVNGKLVTQSGAPANGLDSYASYVLGLDAETKTSVPAAVVQPNVDQSKGIMLYVPNVIKTNLPNSGYKVMFQVQKKNATGDWDDEGEPVEVGNPVSIPYADGSQRYRVNTILK